MKKPVSDPGLARSPGRGERALSAKARRARENGAYVRGLLRQRAAEFAATLAAAERDVSCLLSGEGDKDIDARMVIGLPPMPDKAGSRQSPAPGRLVHQSRAPAVHQAWRAVIEEIARERLGFDQLRPGQRRAVQALVDGRDVLAVLPAGGGKSAIYELAGMLRDGPTLVTSPLIALQDDQLAHLRAAGLSALTVTRRTPSTSRVGTFRPVPLRAQLTAGRGRGPGSRRRGGRTPRACGRSPGYES